MASPKRGQELPAASLASLVSLASPPVVAILRRMDMLASSDPWTTHVFCGKKDRTRRPHRPLFVLVGLYRNRTLVPFVQPPVQNINSAPLSFSIVGCIRRTRSDRVRCTLLVGELSPTVGWDRTSVPRDPRAVPSHFQQTVRPLLRGGLNPQYVTPAARWATGRDRGTPCSRCCCP